MNSSIMPCTRGATSSSSHRSIAAAGERLLQDRPVGVVLGWIHLEDGVTEHDAHHLRVAGGAESTVAEDLVHGVVGVRGEELQPLRRLRHLLDAEVPVGSGPSAGRRCTRVRRGVTT